MPWWKMPFVRRPSARIAFRVAAVASPSAIPDEIATPSPIPADSPLTKPDFGRPSLTKPDSRRRRHSDVYSRRPGGRRAQRSGLGASRTAWPGSLSTRLVRERKVPSRKMAAFARLVQFLRHVLGGAQKTGL